MARFQVCCYWSFYISAVCCNPFEPRILLNNKSCRFISPAVVSPETVDVELPEDLGVTIRRGLMVVAKIIQNLANNIFFGKEAHMITLNPFLKENITNVTRFLSEISVCRLCLVYISLS